MCYKDFYFFFLFLGEGIMVCFQNSTMYTFNKLCTSQTVFVSDNVLGNFIVILRV